VNANALHDMFPELLHTAALEANAKNVTRAAHATPAVATFDDNTDSDVSPVGTDVEEDAATPCIVVTPVSAHIACTHMCAQPSTAHTSVPARRSAAGAVTFTTALATIQIHEPSITSSEDESFDDNMPDDGAVLIAAVPRQLDISKYDNVEPSEYNHA
jgi:hypothetical protein